jgi:hypothetical protein
MSANKIALFIGISILALGILFGSGSVLTDSRQPQPGNSSTPPDHRPDWGAKKKCAQASL